MVMFPGGVRIVVNVDLSRRGNKSSNEEQP
jgi:hypothetical protein